METHRGELPVIRWADVKVSTKQGKLRIDVDYQKLEGRGRILSSPRVFRKTVIPPTPQFWTSRLQN